MNRGIEVSVDAMQLRASNDEEDPRVEYLIHLRNDHSMHGLFMFMRVFMRPLAVVLEQKGIA